MYVRSTSATVLAVALGVQAFTAVTAHAQVSQAELAEIRSASPSKIDFIMKGVAETAAQSLPAQVDEITTITSAIFLKHNRTLTYFGRVSRTLPEQEQFQFSWLSKEQFCRSQMNKAFLAKGVKYEYRYAMPKGDLVFTFDSGSCQ